MQDIWSALHHNQVVHECSFTLLLGTVSKVEMVATTDDQGRTSIKQKTRNRRGSIADDAMEMRRVFTVSLGDLESR